MKDDEVLKRALLVGAMRLPDELCSLVSVFEDEDNFYVLPKTVLGRRYFAMICTRMQRFHGQYFQGRFEFAKKKW